MSVMLGQLARKNHTDNNKKPVKQQAPKEHQACGYLCPMGTTSAAHPSQTNTPKQPRNNYKQP
ncbi:MAG: hypothetical protein HOP02_04225 [Methylococcaceae bacterium]|nr:hypothetical protein [Methylococcaceae bacterium]NOT83987.1 hypothetical protein [Methylococcaceae bacterium]